MTEPKTSTLTVPGAVLHYDVRSAESSRHPVLLTIGSLVAIYLIASTSLHLVIRMGHISFAHAGMMGIGAYVSADTMMKLSFPFAFSISCAAAASALVACVFDQEVRRL